MSPDHPPIPRDKLPPGWGPADCCDDQFVYRHRQPAIELVADRTSADRSHPGLGLGRCWELRYRYALTDWTITEAIGRVSTRRAAVTGILECMHRIHDSIDEPADHGEVRDVLERVRFSDVIPDDLTPKG
ncbi:hypothetical protein [Natronorubrum sulfidifaciens]|uniref:Uncharacterized protein n=1 Tax=Natronorubrum sulfidifaciens JCM 14089 TaxID=1230460 RepID=L9WAC4_9EURY|nr:hypothetical protein [Natronorubrum sulfidifaciens]ELY46322.1 hypothetical protein C495_07108 [Natronorubrum sulfidifaciens JCM 14089]